MFEVVHADCVAHGIMESMKRLNECGKVSDRENQSNADQCKEIQLLLEIDSVKAEPFISRCIVTDLKGLASYDHEILDGTADNAGWAYTYHSLYKPYLQPMIDELKRNIYTRRARLNVGEGDLLYTGDPPCLNMMLFSYVDGRLDMTIVFRSNDGVKAFPMNIHALAMLHLKVAEEVGVEPGAMHYIANNFHAYSKDWQLLDQYCKNFDRMPDKRLYWSYEDIMKVL